MWSTVAAAAAVVDQLQQSTTIAATATGPRDGCRPNMSCGAPWGIGHGVLPEEDGDGIFAGISLWTDCPDPDTSINCPNLIT
jgi:hypothetical protein